MTTPFVSVVIPTFNRARYVGQAIRSVLAQTFYEYEIIVVDDGSTDDTPQQVAAYADRVRYLRRENGGLSRARNTGIEAARAEWVAFLDDDDEFAPGKLAVHAESASRHPQVDVHATNTTIVQASGERFSLFDLRGMPDPGEYGLVRNPVEWVIRSCFFTQSVMFRRQALLDVGLFDPQMIYEDLDLFCRLAPRGPWAIDGRELVLVYRREQTSYCLSQGIAGRPLVAHACLIRIFDRLISQPNLSAGERAQVRRRLSHSRLELATALDAAGRHTDARIQRWQAPRDDPRLKVWAKAMLPALFGRGARSLLSRFALSRAPGLRRSTAQS